MSNVVVEEMRFTADTAGLDRAAQKVEQLAAQMAAAGMKMPKTMRQGMLDVANASAAAAKATGSVSNEAEAATKRFASMTRQAETIQRQFDTNYRNAIRQAGVEDRLNKLVEASVITRQRANEVLSLAAARHGQVAKAAEIANDNVGLAGHQVSNLRSQIIDMGTMLAGGASPFMIISSQAGQVYEALGSGPKGVSGSLKAIGSGILSLATRSNLIVGGLTAAAGAALYFATRSDSSVKSATEALADYKRTLDEIGPGYERAATAAKAALDRARPEGPSVAGAIIGESRDVTLASLGAEMGKLVPKTQGFVTEWKDVTPAMLAAQTRLRSLGADLEARRITVGEFRQGVAQIRLPDGTPLAVRQMVSGILDASVAARDLTNQLKAIDAAAGAAAQKMGRLGTTGNQPVTLGERFGRSALDARMDPDAMDGIRDKLKQQQEEYRKTDSAAAEYAKTIEEQRRSIADNVAGLQLQIDHIGETEGAMAAARMQADMLAEAEKNAAEAKQKVDPALIGFVKQQASEYGALTDRLHDLNEAEEKRKKLQEFDADLKFRGEQLSRTPLEQRVAEEMRANGLVYGSAADAGREATLRFIETMEQARDKTDDLADGFKDAFGSIVDAIGDGENAMKAIIAGLADFGRRQASLGADKLFDWLSGSGSSPFTTASSIATKQATIAASVPNYSGIGSDRVALSATSAVRSASASSALTSSPAVTIWNFFKGKGLSNEAVAGIMGNGFGESAYNPRAVGDSGKALGLFQWNSRADALKDFTGGDWQDLNKQLEFAWHELNTSEKGVLEGLKNSKSVAESTQAFLGFERPRGYSSSDPTRSDNYSGRLSAAQAAYSKYGDASEMRKAVAGGNLDSTRAIAAGAVPGLMPSARAQTALNAGWDGFSNPGGGGLQGFMQSTAGQGLFTGLGAAAQGYSSGSPLGGAFSGLMGGLATGNPIMAGVGAVAGPIGGRLGRKARRAT